jgi:hypothetical protein
MDGGLALYTYDTAEKAFSFTENGAQSPAVPSAPPTF